MGPQLPPEGASGHAVGKLHPVEQARQLSGGPGHGGFPAGHVHRADHCLPLGEPFGVAPHPHIAKPQRNGQQQDGGRDKQPLPAPDLGPQLVLPEAQGVPDGLLLRLLPTPPRKQLGDGEVQGFGQRLQQADVGAVQTPLPFAHRLDRHMKPLRQIPLGQLPFSAYLSNQLSGLYCVHCPTSSAVILPLRQGFGNQPVVESKKTG